MNSRADIKPLKPRQINAIQLLAMGKPLNEVAEIVQVSTMTLFRWKQQPEFSSRLHAIANSGLEEIAKKLNSTSLTAIETIQEVLCDMTMPAPLRVKAALGVMNSMASVNNAINKSLEHRTADFDFTRRWDGPAFTYDSAGKAIMHQHVATSCDEVEMW